MANLILKVTPEEVRSKGTEISNQRNMMESFMNDMQSKVTSLGDSWKAGSGESYIDKYQNVKNDIQRALEALQKHSDNLVRAAERYEELENSQTQAVNSLSTGGIF